MHTFSFQTRVSYDHIDQNMDLTLKGALGYMQEAAMIHSSRSGYSVGDVERTHVTWMLIQWRARLVEGAKWNELVTVETWPRTMERATSTRNFELRRQNGRIAAVGESNWVLVNAETGRIMRITPEVAAAYDLTERDVFDTPMPEVPFGGGDVTYACTVGRRDIDTNHHVNNRVYLDYALEALPAEIADTPFREVSVRYRRQLLLGDTVRCRYCQNGNQHIVDICGEDLNLVHGTVIFTV